MPSMADRLVALARLRDAGVLTEVEFGVAKAKVIAEGEPGPPAVPSAPPPPGSPPKTLHPVVPGVGLALGAGGGFAG